MFAHAKCSADKDGSVKCCPSMNKMVNHGFPASARPAPEEQQKQYGCTD